MARIRLIIVMKLSSRPQYQMSASRFRSINPMLKKMRPDAQKLPLKIKTIKKIATSANTSETVSSRGKSLYCSQVRNTC